MLQGHSDDRTKHEEKTITIIVNARPKTVPKNAVLTYDQIVALAFENPPTGDGVDFTILYTRGPEDKPSGTLVKGESIKVKEGMEFDVTATNRS